MVEPIIPPAYSAIGPVSGVIIALCLVIGFAMYCYRQNLDSANEQLYAAGNNSAHDNQFGMPLSRFDYDDINPHDDGDLGGNSMNRNLLRPAAGMPVADISPYRMNAGGYRAPPPNAESDHGYSTMTPREDSEHLCFALAEPLINNKRISMSDSASINTSVSSPTNHNHLHHPSTHTYFGAAIDKTKLPLQQHSDSTILGMTTLPTSPHHIQAPVTVHHPMETV